MLVFCKQMHKLHSSELRVTVHRPAQPVYNVRIPQAFQGFGLTFQKGHPAILAKEWLPAPPAPPLGLWICVHFPCVAIRWHCVLHPSAAHTLSALVLSIAVTQCVPLCGGSSSVCVFICGTRSLMAHFISHSRLVLS